jgi:gas vesicle protein
MVFMFNCLLFIFKHIAMTTRGKIALGIFGAAAAGVVIGLLLAPEKGSEVRKRIKRTTGTWVDNVGHLFKKGKYEEKMNPAEVGATM